MRRLIVLAAVVVAGVGATATTALAGGPIDGFSSGRGTLTVSASASCLPFSTSPTAAQNLCRYQLHGSYFDDSPILGDGTYTGSITLNFGDASNPNRVSMDTLNPSNMVIVGPDGVTTVPYTVKSGVGSYERFSFGSTELPLALWSRMVWSWFTDAVPRPA